MRLSMTQMNCANCRVEVFMFDCEKRNCQKRPGKHSFEEVTKIQLLFLGPGQFMCCAEFDSRCSPLTVKRTMEIGANKRRK